MPAPASARRFRIATLLELFTAKQISGSSGANARVKRSRWVSSVARE